MRAARRARPGAALLVVDDGSRDDTAGVARRAGAAVLRLPYNLGYGAALQTGYLWASRHGFQAVAQMDADGQHEAGDLGRILGPLERGKADLVIGSRYLGGSSYRGGAVRRLGSRFFAALASLFTGQRLTDPTSGFKAVSGALIEVFASRVYPPDYPDADLLIYLKRRGFRLMEVPVRMRPNSKPHTMHSGWRPLYYLAKVMLSLFLNLLR